jgi:hypothetical protein
LEQDAVATVAPSRAFARGRAAQLRTAKSCGPDAPMLAFKLAMMLRITLATVTNKPVTGESTK